MADLDGFCAVVPAGGSGTRLWPLSRAAHPKFLHALTGSDRTLLQATLDRLAPLAAPERTYVVTGGAHAAAVARQLPALPAGNVLVEPGPRDSAPAIGLAAALLARHDPRAVMGSFAADHLVRDPEAFADVVRTAVRAAAGGDLLTVGITPTAPETGFGYIRTGADLGGGALRVEEFKEKPSAEVARSYLESGRYLWNASMFVWRCDALLEEMDRQVPELSEGLREIAASWDTADREETLAAVWPALPKISVDHAVMEGAAARGRVATVPGTFGWDDVGDWNTLGEVLPARDDGTVVVGAGARGSDGVLALATERTVLVPASGRLVATLGVRDLVVVDTPDAVLVCSRERAQEVKALVAALGERGDTGRL